MQIPSAEQVVLVDQHGSPVGQMDKLEAHRRGLLHLAFSVFLFNRAGQMLLQQRAPSKYHFAGLWSNACCSHPRPGEAVEQAAHRRLYEELGIDARLRLCGQMIYRFYDAGSGLTEHELDYVFFGEHEGPFAPDPQQAQALRWISADRLREELQYQEHQFTPWFKLIARKLWLSPES